jgi:hypothetical protein
MERPIKIVFDVETGEEKYIPLTDKEFADMQAGVELEAARQAELEAARLAEEAARESARAKLAALGLTEAEVAALVK